MVTLKIDPYMWPSGNHFFFLFLLFLHHILTHASHTPNAQQHNAQGQRSTSSSLFSKPVELLNLSHLTGGTSSLTRHYTDHKQSIQAMSPNTKLNSSNVSDENVTLVTLALQTLHTFDFYKNHPQGAFQVLSLVRECVINCLDDEVRSIRKTATITCCNICQETFPHMHGRRTVQPLPS